MPGTAHLLVGAAIAALVSNVPLMVVLAFFSHYVLDFLPHLDADAYDDGVHPYGWWQKATLIADVTLVITLLIGLWWIRHDPLNLLLGAVVAQMPDLLIPLERHPVFLPLRRMHIIAHWDKTRIRRWRWYIPALVVPIVISIGSLFIIWFTLMHG